MSTLVPRQLPFTRLVALCGLLSCTDPEQPVGYEGSTTGGSTEPEVLTTAPDTPTTTQNASATTLDDDERVHRPGDGRRGDGHNGWRSRMR